ncbi:MAG: hypothetical protein PHN82_01125 [bacterium]|nr:hypothetical protein [bacterium]
MLKSKGPEDEVARREVDAICHSPAINRLGIRGIVELVESSPFPKKDISATRDTRRKVPEGFAGKLPCSGDELGVRDVRLLLLK